MLGDSGSNALGALLGLSSVDRFTGRRQVAGDRSAGRASTSSASAPHSTTRSSARRSAPLDRLGRRRVSGRPSTSSSPAGVVSSLGKGITAASLGRLLKARGLKVDVQKFDPYLNVDPGTMSPFQHGEVFVTEDGAETDLDIGHYERFLDQNLLAEREPHAGRDLGPRPAHASGRATTSARPSR